jgi:hypothetical protein
MEERKDRLERSIEKYQQARKTPAKSKSRSPDPRNLSNRKDELPPQVASAVKDSELYTHIISQKG